jgi:hypothetical protein
MTPGAIKNQVIVSRHKKQLAKMEQPPVKPVEKSKPLEE